MYPLQINFRAAFSAFVVTAALLAQPVHARDPFTPVQAGAKSKEGPNVLLTRSGPPRPALMPLPPPLPSELDNVPNVPPPPAPPEMPPQLEHRNHQKHEKTTESFAGATSAPNCNIKVKSDSVEVPSSGGVITLALGGSSRGCVKAILIEQNWLATKGKGDASNIKLEVDANSTRLPRQASITLANSAQSVTVTLVQEGRPRFAD